MPGALRVPFPGRPEAALPGPAGAGAPDAPDRGPRDLHQRLLPGRSPITRSGKSPADVTVVRTGPDPERLRARPEYPELRRGRRFLAAYIGVMGPQDGVDIVVRAADIVVHKLGRDDIAFTLIGSGDCFDELVALRDELDLAGHVEFTGRAPDDLVGRIMSTADVGLSPDPKNPLNDVSTMNKTMEYMAFELPVVAFDLRETRVSAGDAAVYVTPNDVSEYAKAIVALMDDEPPAPADGQARPGPGRAGAGLEPPAARLPRRLPAPDRRPRGDRTDRELTCAVSQGATSRPTARSSSTS